MQAGIPGDRETVAELAGVETLTEAYRLKLPASPHQAAAAEGIAIDPGALMPPEDDVVIEGAGGLMVPLTRQTLFIEVFARWQIPLILCARTALGTINHTTLSVQELRRRGITVAGIILVRTVADRQRSGVGGTPIQVHDVPHHYVSSEETSLPRRSQSERSAR